MTTVRSEPKQPPRFWIFAALLWKELRELRAATIAGLAIFVVLPAWVIGLYALASGGDVLAGTVVNFTLLFGWLFAAVVAAQTICRDLGRPSGEFLRAFPVSSIALVHAKVLASFALVLGLLVVAKLDEPLLGWAADVAGRDWHALWLAAAGLTLLSYWVALVVAALTRNMLTAVMAATLMLALVLIAPLISRDVAAFAPWTQNVGWSEDASRAWPIRYQLFVFIGVGALAVLAYLVTALTPWQAPVRRIGTPTVAWTVAGLLLLTTVAAIREVGANHPVADLHWYPTNTVNPDEPWHNQSRRIAAGQGRFVRAEMNGELYRYEFNDAGKLTATRGGTRLPSYTAGPPALAFDEDNTLWGLGFYDTTPNGGDRSDKVMGHLLRIDWVSGEPQVISRWETPFEPGIRANQDVTISRTTVTLKDVVISDGTLYFLCEQSYQKGTVSAFGTWDHSAWIGVIDVAAPDRVYVSDNIYRGGAWNLSLRQITGKGAFFLQKEAAALNLNSIDVDGDGFRSSYQWLGDWYRGTWPTDEPGTGLGFDHEGVWFDRVSQYDEFVTNDRFIVWQPSPWGQLFRRTSYSAGVNLYAGRAGQVWEFHDSGARCFDVSDPLHVELIAHVNTYPIRQAARGPDVLILEHLWGFSIVPHPGGE